MDIANLTALKNTLAIEPKLEGLQLRVGQTLTATVQTKLSQNLFELLVNNQRLQARSERPLTPGQNLKLVVEKVDNPIVLRALPASQEPALEAKLQLQAIRTEWLRNSMPKPASLEPLVKQLNQLQANTPSALPKTAQQELGRFIERFQPVIQLANKTGLVKAFKQSGLFYEAALASVALQSGKQDTLSAATGNDLKAQLLRLSERLQHMIQQDSTKPAPKQAQTNTANNNNPPNIQPKPDQPSLPVTNRQAGSTNNLPAPINEASQSSRLREWLQPVDQALNKIQLQQNQAIALDRNENVNWNFSIPIVDDGILQLIDLNIFQDSNHQRDTDSQTWRIEIAMEIENLGAIQARLSLYGEQLSLIIYAEQPTTAELMQQHLEILNQDIMTTGLEISDIRCVCGQMESKAPAPQKESLVDLHL